MAGLASINIKFFADLKQFSTQMQNANRKLQKMGKQLQSLGTTLSVGVTAPFVGFSVLALKNWDTQEKAIAQVEAGLSSVGDSVGYTSEQLQKMASGLQDTSLFGDEDILKNVTAQLLTFTNIANEEFSRTQKVALDLATRLGGDLKGASIQLGKALNDPIANLSALSRSGIQFSEDQKALIKSFAQTNRLADAQNVILNELEKQYGGSAAAAAKAGTGSFKQLSNSIGDLSEEFGKIIGEFLLPFVEKIKDLVAWFQKLSVSTKKIIVVVSAFAAALGPLLLSLGFLMTTVVPGLTAAFAGLSAVIVANPLGVLAVALSVVVSGVLLLASNLGGVTDVTEQWSEVTKKATKSIADEKLQLDKNLIVARDEGKSKKERLKAIDALKKQYPKYLDFLSLENINTEKTKDATNKLIDALLVKAKVQAAQEKMVEVEKKLLDLQLGQNEAIKPSLWQNMGAALKSFGNQTQFQIQQSTIIAENYGKEKTALEDLRNSLRDYISDNDDLVASLNKVKKASIVPPDTLNKGGRRKVTDILSDQRGEDDKLQQTVNLGIVKGIKVEGEELKTELQGIQQSFIDFSEQTSSIIAESTSSFLAGFGEMIGGLFTGSVTIADIGGMILRTVGDFLKKLGKAAIQVGVAAKAIHLAFTNPFAAIAAGVALIAIGSVFSNLATQQSQGNAVPFAKGGIVYGPTNALIGEYSGASSNPEVVAPLNKLKELITPASQNLDIKVGGLVWTELGKLKVALNQHEIRKNRTT